MNIEDEQIKTIEKYISEGRRTIPVQLVIQLLTSNKILQQQKEDLIDVVLAISEFKRPLPCRLEYPIKPQLSEEKHRELAQYIDDNI